MCSGRVSSSWSTSSTCRVTFVTNPVISQEWGKDTRKVFLFNELHRIVQFCIMFFIVPWITQNRTILHHIFHCSMHYTESYNFASCFSLFRGFYLVFVLVRQTDGQNKARTTKKIREAVCKTNVRYLTNTPYWC
jgi:hypothetical protein